MKKLGAGFPTKRGTRRKISGELFLVVPAWWRARCKPVRPTRITTGGRGGRRKVRKFVEATPGLAIGQRGTRNGGPSGTFILHFLRPSPLARSLYPSATATSPPFSLHLRSPPSYRLFFWFFPVTSPPLPLLCLALASKVTPRNPCGKVWLFNFLPRFARVLSPSSTLLLYLSGLSRSAILSTSFSFRRHSCYETVHFSATDDRYFLSSSLLFVVGNNFPEGKISRRTWSLRKTDTADSAIRIHLQLGRYFCVCNSFFMFLQLNSLVFFSTL